jgi:hypothetical protein
LKKENKTQCVTSQSHFNHAKAFLARPGGRSRNREVDRFKNAEQQSKIIGTVLVQDLVTKVFPLLILLATMISLLGFDFGGGDSNAITVQA